MKKYVIRVEFKGHNQIGYFRSEESITAFKEKALVCSKLYAEGLCRGINFYGDEECKQAYVEELQ